MYRFMVLFLLFVLFFVFTVERHTFAVCAVETSDSFLSADDAVQNQSEQFRKTEHFRMDFCKKIRRGSAVRRDYDACKNILESIASDEQKHPFYISLYVLLAQYHRIIDREGVKAIEILAPLILESETASHWITEQRTAAQKAFENWSAEIKTAKQTGSRADKSAERPEGIFSEFPETDKWNIDDKSASACIEVARNLILLNRHDAALEAINAVGARCCDENKILAAECAADLMSWTKSYADAVEFYDLALSMFRSIKEDNGEFLYLRSDEQQVIKNRIYYKRGAIYKLAEQERFTPDWLAYREAQRKQFIEESLLEAYWMYIDVVKNYPDTLSAEASECNIIKILSQFSNPSFGSEAARRYALLEEQLEDAQSQLRHLKRIGTALPFRVGFENYVERLQFVVKMFAKTPFGKEALTEAARRADDFIAKNKYGLYRGEVLLDLGRGYLLGLFDVETGGERLEQAAMWFEEAEQFDKDLREFELAESVRKVSQPPKSERYRDRWNNVKLSQPKPGDYFNRRTCSWYVDSKKKDIVLLQGLCAFAKEDYAKAKEHWDKLSELDKEFYTQQKADGWENATTLARLTWNLKNQKGCLYATPEEMASFKDKKRRLAVLLADLFYESEKHKEALSIYRRLEIGRELGTLSKNELAYVMLGTFACLCWDTKSDEIQYIVQRAKLFKGTVSEPRIILGYCCRIVADGKLKSYETAVQNLEYLIGCFPDSEYSYQARFILIDNYKMLAWYANSLHDKNKAKEFLMKAYKYCNDCIQNTEQKEHKNILERIKTDLEKAIK